MKKTVKGWTNGFIGMLIFSGSMPATRLALESFEPVFLTAARAFIAGILGLALIFAFREKRPARDDLFVLCIVAAGVVIGFPLLTAFALTYITSAESLVFIGLLPLATAIFGFVRGGERPHRAFWFFAVMGSALVVIYALTRAASQSITGNLLMLAAIVVCGLGYAEGAKLSRRLGGWQVISWSLVLSLPLMSIFAVIYMPPSLESIKPAAWGGLAYVSLFSMLIGFVFWYRGLAQGGISAVGQLQLLQPFFGLFISAILLHEIVKWPMVMITIAAVFCVAGAKIFSSQAVTSNKPLSRGIP
jgi:drug/metabolite transporter (DMT)-like permease